MNCKHTIIILLFITNQLHAASDSPQKTVKEIAGLVSQYCSTCHNPPSPDLLPKESWPYVVKYMADLAETSMGHKFISDEHVRDITAFYYGNSPKYLPRLPYHPSTNNDRKFIISELGRKSATPLTVNVKSVNLIRNDNTEFLICDSEKNQVSLLTKKGKIWQEKVLADIQVPSHTEVIDYDLDGDKDIIVGSLGLFFPPQGQLAGKVFLLRQSPTGEFNKELLIENVGRITDARPLDIDGDNDIDIAIAIFGADAPGELAWLENLGNGKHVKHTLLNAGGGLNISPTDLNGDGMVDFVSLVSQEHELVAALINTGKGQFRRTLLFKAAHPMVGFTSMRLVDLDGDKDVDFLFSNGDANDLQTDPKPYHGIQWLENKGNLKFQYHDIGRFYGAVSAVAGDLDADGDLDIVASSWNNYWDDPKRQSLIWFENDGKQNFSRHNITNRPQDIVTLELEDVTGDGQLDIIAGVLRIGLLKNSINNPEKNNKEVLQGRIILFENKGIIH